MQGQSDSIDLAYAGPARSPIASWLYNSGIIFLKFNVVILRAIRNTGTFIPNSGGESTKSDLERFPRTWRGGFFSGFGYPGYDEFQFISHLKYHSSSS